MARKKMGPNAGPQISKSRLQARNRVAKKFKSPGSRRGNAAIAAASGG